MISVVRADERSHGWWCSLNRVLEQPQGLWRGSIPPDGSSSLCGGDVYEI